MDPVQTGLLQLHSCDLNCSVQEFQWYQLLRYHPDPGLRMPLLLLPFHPRFLEPPVQDYPASPDESTFRSLLLPSYSEPGLPLSLPYHLRYIFSALLHRIPHMLSVHQKHSHQNTDQAAGSYHISEVPCTVLHLRSSIPELCYFRYTDSFFHHSL